MTALFRPGTSLDTFTPDDLIAGDFPLMTRPIVLKSGQDLPRGAVLGEIGSTGTFVLSVAAATDGSEVPAAILVDDTDASAGDVASAAYDTGEFLGSALTLGAGHTLGTIRAPLRAVSIFLR